MHNLTMHEMPFNNKVNISTHSQTILCATITLLRPAIKSFARPEGEERGGVGGSESRMPKIKVNINQLK